ncbi:MAG: precorrin-3B C(17)-methyltransferase [Actinomycetota bacterium]
MTIVAISITAAGAANAARLPYAHVSGELGPNVRRLWPEVDGLVLFCATGIAVRVVAPLLASKHDDPAVVVVDEAARWVVPLVGGHGAGANALAVDVAALLNAEAVLTTATDATATVALDQLPGFVAEGDVAGVTRRLLDGEHPRIVNPLDWPLPDTLPAVDATATTDEAGVGEGAGPRIVVTDERVPAEAGAVVLRPPSRVVGVGASSDAPADAARSLLDEVLAAAGLAEESVGAVATIDRRAPDPVVTSLGHEIRSFTGAELSVVEVPNPSDVVAAEVGTASVAEAAALLAAGPGAELVVEKHKGATATVAVARRARPAGQVWIVGLGPGARRHRTPAATAAVRHAEVVIGYSVYVDQVIDLTAPHQEVVRSPIGAEVDRCDEAVRRAAAGKRVALVCSGDPGVFAMATLALELAGRHGHPAIEVVPGVTASLAASSLLGAPLAHDHALISLSDLLTPWPLIERRLRAVAEADMAVALYNPRSMRRTTQLEQARTIFMEQRGPDTPVGVVTNATREGERIVRTTLGGLDPAGVDMFSIVVIGSSTTRFDGGAMVTPRGYDS